MPRPTRFAFFAAATFFVACTGGEATTSGVTSDNGGAASTSTSTTASGTGGAATSSTSTSTSSASGGGTAAWFTPGLFALLATDGAASQSLYSTSSVTGFAVRTAWSTNEPDDGVFDWSYLDKQVQAAKSAGKKLSIEIAADVPQWLVDAGVETVSLKSPNGKQKTISIPWDPIFLDRFTKLVAAFGARYAEEPTVAYVRGASEAVTNGWGLSFTLEDGSTLADHGYMTPDTLLAPMKQVLDAFMKAFPITPEWIEVGIVAESTSFGIPTDSWFGEQIADYGFQQYPDRMGVWREDLSACTPNPPKNGDWQIIAAHPGKNGAQMVWNVEDGPDFRMNHCMKAQPNDAPTVMHAAIANGLCFGMRYFEVYATDWGNPAVAATLDTDAKTIH